MTTWSTRRERYGEKGHPVIRVLRLRFRVKPLRSRGKVAIVARETSETTPPDRNLKSEDGGGST